MRNTYVLRNNRLVRKSAAAPLSRGYFNVLPDITPFQTQEGTPISSRSGLREYERKHGTRQVGNDFATFHRELRQKVRGVD